MTRFLLFSLVAMAFLLPAARSDNHVPGAEPGEIVDLAGRGVTISCSPGVSWGTASAEAWGGFGGKTVSAGTRDWAETDSARLWGRAEVGHTGARPRYAEATSGAVSRECEEPVGPEDAQPVWDLLEDTTSPEP